ATYSTIKRHELPGGPTGTWAHNSSRYARPLWCLFRHDPLALRTPAQALTPIKSTGTVPCKAQLAGAAAPAVSLPRERQVESSHRRSRVPPVPQEQQVESPRRSHRAPSEERALERRGRSPQRSIISPRPPRSVMGGNSHASGRGGPANSEQELARRLRRVVDLERRMDAMV
ncbi:hypothetical protein Taro_027624, partial [Colocasia esculenta]|nr:hypothetical protein [Colocasia esculenta]